MTQDAGDAPPTGAPQVRFHLPADALRPLVTSYYFVDAPGLLSDLSHPEWANIRVVLRGLWRVGPVGAEPTEPPPDAAIYGATDRTMRFATDGGAFLGIGLSPLGWLSLIGRDASRIANRVVPLGAALGMPDDVLVAELREAPDDRARIELLDRLLLARVRRPGAYHDIAGQVQAALLEGELVQVAELAATLGVEPRTLHRVCRQVFGFSPMRLIRRQRFLRTLAQVRDSLDGPLGRRIDTHYYDQAHFNRDFKAYMGMTPLAYFNSPREVLRRAFIGRDQLLGAPLQGLHVPSKA